MEALAICLPYELLRLQGSSLESFFFVILFPWLCAIGLVGNCLNLVVLLSPEVRKQRLTRRSNSLLVALAICDIVFLLLILPHTLAQFDRFGLLPGFRILYLSLRVHLIAFANWCSAVAIWLVIAVCAERLLGIRSFWRRSDSRAAKCCCSTAHLIIAIVLMAGLLTSYNHFSYHCVVKYLCNHQQVISKCFDVLQEAWPGNHTNLTPHLTRVYVRWSIVANVVLVIVLPILIMAALNIALVAVVRKQSFMVYTRLNSSLASTDSDRDRGEKRTARRRRCSAPTLLAANADGNGGKWTQSGKLPPVTATTTFQQQMLQQRFRRSIDHTTQFQAEHRVTVTVCAIVTCFTLTQGPSAIVLSMSFFSGGGPPALGARSDAFWQHLNSLTGFLVIVGKTLNFILFCLSSTTFRRRLLVILRRKAKGWRGRQAGGSQKSQGGSSLGANNNSSIIRRHLPPPAPAPTLVSAATVAPTQATTPVATTPQAQPMSVSFATATERKFSLAV